MSTVIIYASTAGNTKAAAEYIASKTGGRAIPVSAVEESDIDWADTVVFGSRIHAGGVSKEILRCMEDNKDLLSGKSVSMYVCCMFNGEKGDNQCKTIGDKVGMECTYFTSMKKKLKNNDTLELDAFIAKL